MPAKVSFGQRNYRINDKTVEYDFIFVVDLLVVLLERKTNSIKRQSTIRAGKMAILVAMMRSHFRSVK